MKTKQFLTAALLAVALGLIPITVYPVNIKVKKSREHENTWGKAALKKAFKIAVKRAVGPVVTVIAVVEFLIVIGDDIV